MKKINLYKNSIPSVRIGGLARTGSKGSKWDCLLQGTSQIYLSKETNELNVETLIVYSKVLK